MYRKKNRFIGAASAGPYQLPAVIVSKLHVPETASLN